jgi:hypothetical protein
VDDERLAHEPLPEPIDYQLAQRIAALAHRLAQLELERGGRLVPNARDSRAFAPWHSLPGDARHRMAAGVIRVVQALQLLELLEPAIESGNAGND